jgi:hypothetical protein
MSKVDENLSAILNTEYTVVEDTNFKAIQVVENSSDNQVQTDAEYARSNLYGLIEKGNETIDNISEIARESMHPRAFEVLGQLMKTQSENLDKLLKLQKDKKELLKTGEQITTQQNINVDKAVFVGSTAELLKKLKNESAD